MPTISNLTLRLTHTGLYSDGSTNAQGILIDDLNTGGQEQNRKHTVYLPANSVIDLPLTDRVLFSYTQGSLHGYVQSGQVVVTVPISTATESTISWHFETATNLDYVGGFYDFAPSDNDFSPSITHGSANLAIAAHFFVVTGEVTSDAVTITVTGTSITDTGVNTPADSEVILIPAGTAINSYFETAKKWNGVITIETTAGTAITCNSGYAKYWNHNHRDFDIIGLETIWSSQSSDSTSNITLCHHKPTGWTFNAGSTPSPPIPLADRTTDHGADVAHSNGGQGAWKRENITQHIVGSNFEGLLWQVDSGSTGIGTQSFRALDLLVIVQECPLGIGFCSA